MLAAIPYTTFPEIQLGPLTLRTFGLFVALGVVVGAWVGASYAERFGVDRDASYRVAMWMVLAGIIGSRLTWAATNPDQIENLVDVIAIWEGGIQFSGGFIAALIVGLPMLKKWPRLERWRALDGFAWGFTIGVAIGRIGCYAVGEHFGRTTDFFLATRYDGGDVREPTLGDLPLTEGTVFHNTALYEFIYLVVLFALLGGLVWGARRRGREVAPGTLVGVFIVYYGVVRFLSDALRVNDERVLGLTGAQWMCLAMIPLGLWVLIRRRPELAALVESEAARAELEAVEVPDEVEVPEAPAGAEVAIVASDDQDDASGEAPPRVASGPEEEAAEGGGGIPSEEAGVAGDGDGNDADAAGQEARVGAGTAPAEGDREWHDTDGAAESDRDP